MNPTNPPLSSHPESDVLVSTPTSINIQPSSPRFLLTTTTSDTQRMIAITIDLSNESAYAVQWAIGNYLQPGDDVILLHMRPTSILYGNDWGSVDLILTNDSDSSSPHNEGSQNKLGDDFYTFTSTKAADMAQPLVEVQISFKIHIVKDHDMKEQLCLEVEKLGLSAVIMGSRGFGVAKRSTKRRLSISDYCIHRCICLVVFMRYPDENEDGIGDMKAVVPQVELHPVPKED